jgi:hypothetical protein
VTKSVTSDPTTVYIATSSGSIPIYGGNLAKSDSTSTVLTFSGLYFITVKVT